MPACANLPSVILVFLVTAPPAAARAAPVLTIGDEAQVDTLDVGSGYRAGDLGYWIGNDSLGYVYDCWGDDVSLDDPSSRIFCRTYFAGAPLTDPPRRH